MKKEGIMHQSLSRLHLLRRKANFQDFSTTLSARIKNQQTKSNDITLFLTLQIMPPLLLSPHGLWPTKKRRDWKNASSSAVSLLRGTSHFTERGEYNNTNNAHFRRLILSLSRAMPKLGFVWQFYYAVAASTSTSSSYSWDPPSGQSESEIYCCIQDNSLTC